MRIEEHNEWEGYMLLFSILLWVLIIIVLILIPYYFALRHYCANAHGLDAPDAACQAAFW